ncbi:MAG: YchJ family protein [Pseudomonadota bacterium]
MTENLCPCTSGTPFPECCEPYLNGAKIPETAEQMMRARYTAHTRVEMEFVVNTHHPDTAQDINVEGTRQWAAQSEWLGLDIVRAENGRADDKSGKVEFIAHYRDRNGIRQVHHEVSLFDKVNGEWRFRDAELPHLEQIKRDAPKVGRNDPCPCGSEKKYKKCCGKVA